MIKLRKGNKIVLGLSEENIRRLHRILEAGNKHGEALMYILEFQRELIKNSNIPRVILPFPLSSAHEMWQMAKEMTHDEFINYYNKLINGMQT